MKLVSYRKAGIDGYGVVVGEGGIVDAGKRLGLPSLRAVLAQGRLADLKPLAAMAPDFSLTDVELLPPIPDPEKILCVGLNYKSHVAEVGRDLPANPSLFGRFTNTLVAAGKPIIRPKVSSHLDYEGELAMVIGKPGRNISEADALRHVAGYSCFNDGSLRDYQKHSVTAGKNFQATGGFGPWIVTADAVADPEALELTTRLNGQQVQHSNTSLLIYSLAKIISYISEFTALEPGDVIATGTPEGVGARRDPPLWMKAGDVAEVEIAGIGLLRNPIVDQA